MRAYIFWSTYAMGSERYRNNIKSSTKREHTKDTYHAVFFVVDENGCGPNDTIDNKRAHTKACTSCSIHATRWKWLRENTMGVQFI